MFQKVLIANRGEIAVRVARTLRELGVGVVALFTEADRRSTHLRWADEAVALGPDPRAYLDVERIVAAAKAVGADALHPGYGFLSENAALAEACERAGVSFVGPPASAIAGMADKQQARARMQAAGVPVVPGSSATSLEEAEAGALRIGYPVLVKAVNGGGGKGMRRVERAEELAPALERTRSEAARAFGSAAVYLEKALDRPRHVEIQVLGDREGTLVHLYERDCSLQRRHQKIVEETPCPLLPASTLRAMSEAALSGARAIGYFSAGTFEFLLDADGAFYFLEMNTRLQVEHPITELVTGVDLVREMLRVAAGERIDAESPERRGAAVEARVYAEDPARGFLPSPGTLELWREPSGPGVRVDSGVEEGSVVSPEYDPLLAKLAVWAPDRQQAFARLERALSETMAGGIQTNLGLLLALARDPAVLRGEYDTGYLARNPELCAAPALAGTDRDAIGAALAALELGEPGGRAEAPNAVPSPWLLSGRPRWR